MKGEDMGKGDKPRPHVLTQHFSDRCAEIANNDALIDAWCAENDRERKSLNYEEREAILKERK